MVRPIPSRPSERLEKLLRAQGELVRRRRKDKGMTLADVADILHLSRKTLAQSELGKRALTQWEMDILVTTLDILPESFYDPPEPSQTISEPLGPYLSVVVSDAAEEAGEAADQAQPKRVRRTTRKPRSSHP